MSREEAPPTRAVPVQTPYFGGGEHAGDSPRDSPTGQEGRRNRDEEVALQGCDPEVTPEVTGEKSPEEGGEEVAKKGMLEQMKEGVAQGAQALGRGAAKAMDGMMNDQPGPSLSGQIDAVIRDVGHQLSDKVIEVGFGQQPHSSEPGVPGSPTSFMTTASLLDKQGGEKLTLASMRGSAAQGKEADGQQRGREGREMDF